MNSSGEGHEHNPIHVSDHTDHVDEKGEDQMPLTDSPVEMSARDTGGKAEGQNGHAEQADEGTSDDGSDGSEADEDDKTAEAEEVDEEAEEEDEEEEEEEEDDEEGEEEDDDEEPALKYERLGGDFPKLFDKDSASTLTISNKTLVS